MRVVLVRAWPRRHEQAALVLSEGCTVADALAASQLDLAGIAGYAVHGERVEAGRVLQDGDRLELLAPLLVDPKEARRRRAIKPTG